MQIPLTHTFCVQCGQLREIYRVATPSSRTVISMVKLSTITEANARFATNAVNNVGLVCVFAGATSGIGAATIERLAVMLPNATFYVLGRSASRFAGQRAMLESLNSSLKLVFLEAEVSLIADVDAASQKIITAEQRIDYLYMSQACFPINVPQCRSTIFSH